MQKVGIRIVHSLAVVAHPFYTRLILILEKHNGDESLIDARYQFWYHDIMSEPGAMVADARMRAGLSQRELAQRARTSQSVVARIESGAVSPSFETLRRLVAACGFELRLSLGPAGTSDPVVEAYKRDVDRTLLRENLRKTVEQRLGDMEAFRRSAERLRQAVKTGRRSGKAAARSRRSAS